MTISPLASFLIGGALLTAAVLESGTFPHAQPQSVAAAKYAADARLGRELDALCPGQRLYCIPPMYFPDCVIWPRVEPYDNLRPWLHTSRVSFSFGQATNQLSAFDAETASQLLTGRIDFDRIARAGYSGIIIMRSLSPDRFCGLLSNIRPIAVSPDFAVIKLTPPNQ